MELGELEAHTECIIRLSYLRQVRPAPNPMRLSITRYVQSDLCARLCPAGGTICSTHSHEQRPHNHVCSCPRPWNPSRRYVQGKHNTDNGAHHIDHRSLACPCSWTTLRVCWTSATPPRAYLRTSAPQRPLRLAHTTRCATTGSAKPSSPTRWSMAGITLQLSRYQTPQLRSGLVCDFLFAWAHGRS